MNIIGASSFEISLFTDTETYKFISSGDNPNPDVLSINTSKDILNPSGTWSIELTPKKDSSGLTWFDKIDVFSYIEIQFRGIKDTEKKIVMRGVVDRIDKEEAFTAGFPERRIRLSGRDLGALLTDLQVYYIPEIDPEAYVLGMMDWSKDCDPEMVINAQGVFDIFGTKFKEMLYIKVGKNKDINLKDKFEIRAKSFNANATTTWTHLINQQGPWWNFFVEYQDKPLHELFIYDDNFFTRFILRPSRYKDITGTYHKSVKESLSDTVMYPDDFEVEDTEIMSQDFSKSLDEVYTYFITVPKSMLIDGRSMREIGFLEAGGKIEEVVNPYLAMDSSLPAYVTKFGFRPYETNTIFADIDTSGEKAHKDNKSKLQWTIDQLRLSDVTDMNQSLVSWFLYNPLLISGNMTIPGSNRALIGTYVVIQDKENTAKDMEYYVEGVNHNFVVNQSFTTSLRLARGQLKNGGLASTSKIKKLISFSTAFGVQVPEFG